MIRLLSNTFALSPGRLLRRAFKEDRSGAPARLRPGTPGQQVLECLLDGISDQLFYERLQAFQQIGTTRSPSKQESIIISIMSRSMNMTTTNRIVQGSRTSYCKPCVLLWCSGPVRRRNPTSVK